MQSVILIGVGFLVLLLRLWYLQILQGRHYATLSASNRLRLQSMEAPRGFILDRHGAVIVDNRPSFDVYVTPADVPDVRTAALALVRVLPIGAEEIADRIQEGKAHPYRPLLLAPEVDEATMVAVEEQKMDLPGVSLRIRPVRSYPEGSLAAHLLGYVNEVDRDQLVQEEYRDFRAGETVGRAGIERRFDAFLRGIDGGEQIEVDASGRIVRLVERLEPQAGFSLVLTVDRRLQEVAEKAFEGKRGAVLAMDPRTGEILVWVSRPTYDLNLFAQQISSSEWERIASSPTHPLQNRGVQAQYPPGSIFKLVVAMAALEAGGFDPEATVFCPGQFRLGNFTFDDWKEGGHGYVNLHQAIAQSCNVYFYTVALRLGMDAIAALAHEFGLGQPIGIGLTGEVSGLIPTPAWKRRVTGEPWYPGDTVTAAIGQGMVLATPLQILTMVSAIANGGTLYRPWVVRRVESWQGDVVEAFGPEVIRRVQVRSETLEAIRRGMLTVVAEGTGKGASLKGIAVAGKTGTSQVVKKGTQGTEALKDHGWFVAFAPYEDPRIAIVVIAENAGFGSVAALPVARAVLEAALAKPERPSPTPAAVAARE
ncbi:MAG: penicillin-binding protein 2 [Candidatus Methylomirabilales bacterium]